MNKCIGFIGKLFGHKFYTYDYRSNYCYRCGMPKGGWPK